MAHRPPNRLEEFRIHGEIGDDPAELDAVADAVVRGCSICYSRIKSLGALIEAVQRHADATLALPPEAPEEERGPLEALTALRIYGGELLLAECRSVDIRVRLTLATRFAGDASFEDATFAGDASFHRATFVGTASFRGATFAEDASFEDATFAGVEASFDRATFVGTASFGEATFEGAALFDEASFAKIAWFDGATFEGAVEGDLRRCFLRTATFGKRIGTPRRIWHWVSWQVSWQRVRALGQLQILNRVSLFALIAVPVLVACWPAVRALAGAYHRGVAESHAAMDRLLLQMERAASIAPMTDEARRRVLEVTEDASATSTEWQERLAEIVSESPYIGPTLAFVFFAAVCVTLGQLIYQVWAAEDVRKYDRDEFVDRVLRRYTEKATDRGDGLRRSIEHLEVIAKRQPDRHRNLVKHHGDTIWIPPRDRIDWFEDAKTDSTDTRSHESDRSEDAPTGIVPGEERQCITIEEGGAAEYWLKSRKLIGWAFLSFLLYLIGIGFLIVVLLIQLRHVIVAAGWPVPTWLGG